MITKGIADENTKERGFSSVSFGSLGKRVSVTFFSFLGIFFLILPFLMPLLMPLEGYSSEKKTIRFMVSILPQAYFVKKIGGSKVQVNTLLPAGFDPVSYEPTVQKMLQVEKANFYFKVGVESFPLEKRHLPTVLSYNPSVKILDMSKDVPILSFQEEHHSEVDSHEDELHSEAEPSNPEHDHEGLDPHIWTSPKVVMQASKTIYKALAQFDPENQEYYQNRLNRFLQQIQRVDTRIRETLSQAKNKKFIVYHPAWGYFAHEYGLVQLSIEREGKEGSLSHIQRIIEEAKREKVRVVFVQKGFPKESAKLIAKEISAQVIELNPLAENWIATMRRASKVLRKSFLLSQ